MSNSVSLILHGALITLVLQHLLLSVLHRDRSHLEHSMLLIGIALIQLSLQTSGSLYPWLVVAEPWSQALLPAGLAVVGLFGSLLTRSFLRLSDTAPVLDRLIAISGALFGGVFVSLWLLPHEVGVVMLTVLGPLFALLVALCGANAVRQRAPGAVSYLLGWALMLITGGIASVTSGGEFATGAVLGHAPHHGMIFAAFVLSFALFDRAKAMHRESSRSDQAACAASEQTIAALRQSEHLLTTRLAERTEELERANSHLQANAQEREHAAHHDPLTGLANRLLLEDRVAHGIIRAVRHNTRMALLLVSVDGFKHINEEHGHKLGDAALVMVAERLRAAVRQQDTVARVGGDEFAIVLEEVFQQDDADRVATTICDALTEPFVLGEQSVQLSATVGGAFFPENGKNAASLLISAGKQIRTIRDRTSASRKNAPGLTIAETARPAMRR